jgi:hypothetical protein
MKAVFTIPILLKAYQKVSGTSGVLETYGNVSSNTTMANLLTQRNIVHGGYYTMKQAATEKTLKRVRNT